MDISGIILFSLTSILFIVLIIQAFKKNYNKSQSHGMFFVAIGSFIVLFNIFELFQGRTLAALGAIFYLIRKKMNNGEEDDGFD